MVGRQSRLHRQRAIGWTSCIGLHGSRDDLDGSSDADARALTEVLPISNIEYVTDQ